MTRLLFYGLTPQWHDPPPRPPPQGLLGPYTYEPCDDVDPTLDYENVLTD